MKKNILGLIFPIAISALLIGCSLTKNKTYKDQIQESNTSTPTPDKPIIPPAEDEVLPDTPPEDDEQLTPPPVIEVTPPTSNNDEGNLPTPEIPNNNNNNTPTNPKPNPNPPLDEAPPVPSPPASENTGSYLNSVEQEIFRMVNEERKKVGVSPLNYNEVMEKYARIKSKDMGDRNYFSHENPDGKLITSEMKKDGVTYSSWGENIAYIDGSSSSIASEIMSMWLNSKGHKENILSTNFTSIGIGVSKHGNKIYATQEFHK